MGIAMPRWSSPMPARDAPCADGNAPTDVLLYIAKQRSSYLRVRILHTILIGLTVVVQYFFVYLQMYLEMK